MFPNNFYPYLNFNIQIGMKFRLPDIAFTLFTKFSFKSKYIKKGTTMIFKHFSFKNVKNMRHK